MKTIAVLQSNHHYETAAAAVIAEKEILTETIRQSTPQGRVAINGACMNEVVLVSEVRRRPTSERHQAREWGAGTSSSCAVTKSKVRNNSTTYPLINCEACAVAEAVEVVWSRSERRCRRKPRMRGGFLGFRLKLMERFAMLQKKR